ncbi:Fic/DOC family N-terminal domain-containing protein [Bradyrhizobium sp. CB1650]|uniref:Fic family protein n=1 Tax=Bradyrhizobium sp. CB1650 TaxID=3039153 RepID=UPI00243494FD|nr:Fic/DOC family N-terminal domain-containing protein [Bradyrhizobium sp. CB1650]WGD52384.1 Fic/DOC family N-terminal domain-containing protein [Bradyrhizobium sp. CB1650]
MKRSDLSHAIRETLKRLPAPYASHYGIIPPPPPEEGVPIAQAAKALDDARGALGKIDTIAAQMRDPYIVSRILTRREAVSSSSIEGTQSTLDEILSVEETGGDDAEDAARQVRNYAVALDDFIPMAAKDGDRIFTIELVKDLHRAVMKDDPDYQDVPGELRTRVVWIGGGGNIAYSSMNPPPPDDVPVCLAQTVDYLRNEGMQQMTQGLITRMAIAHTHFEAVHPFRDGNGRVGRLLLPLMMAAEKHVPLYLSPYIEAKKGAYYASLKDAQQRLDWQPIIAFMADAVTGTVDELMKTRTALTELSDRWSDRRKFRKGSAAARALEELPHYPVVTAKRLGELLGISPPQAHQAIAQLEGAGILAERTGYSRNRIYAASEALNIINRPFGEEPILPAEAAPDATAE